MKRRSDDADSVLSLDSFLDIVTNVVGVLILLAVVTVLSAGDIAVASEGQVVVENPELDKRVLFECAGDKLVLVRERELGEMLREEIDTRMGPGEHPPQEIIVTLGLADVGDRNYRVSPEMTENGEVVWHFERRESAIGTRRKNLESPDSSFQKVLSTMDPEGFVYFIVRPDCFSTYRDAVVIAEKKGLSTGWHPLTEEDGLEISASGSYGRQLQ